MNTLLRNSAEYFKFRNSMNEYYKYTRHEGKHPLTQTTVSIVMTASNRSKQTLYTLQTIENSCYKDVQVILVDDSDIDPILVEFLQAFTFTIEFVQIYKAKKWWANPCVNYNIGFSFIQGGYVIIQNAEVCHVGDPISTLVSTIKNGEYLVFDVKNIKEYAKNQTIYHINPLTIEIYDNPDIFQCWFHRTGDKETNFHFLTGMTKETFDTIQGFSYDYSFGSFFDDNDILLKIKSANIVIKSICYKKYNCGGIHLYHALSEHTHTKDHESNYSILAKKQHIIQKYGYYFDILTQQSELQNRLSFFMNS